MTGVVKARWVSGSFPSVTLDRAGVTRSRSSPVCVSSGWLLPSCRPTTTW